MSSRPRVLLIAEAANPEWVSVPLIGWSHSRALAEVTDAFVVTQVRNRPALERAGWREGREFTALDTEAVGSPIYRTSQWLRRVTGAGWTLTTAAAAAPYYYFEHLLWKRFGERIRRREFDIVHRLTPLTPTIPSPIAAKCRAAGVPFVWGPINGGVPWPAEFSGVRRAEGEWLSYVRDAYKLLPAYRTTRSCASALIAGSEYVWEQLDDYHDRSVYLPENAVDPARFRRTAEPFRGEPLRVAFIGRLVPYKGADMLIEAAAPLARSGRVAIDIYGDGPEMPRLRALVEREQLAPAVTLHGWVAHEALEEKLVTAQVFGFPSVREFGGGVVLEAMMLGLVPVIVGYAGPNELVSERTGIRVPLGTRAGVVAGVRSALERLLENPGALEEMSRRARSYVTTKFTWQKKAEQVLEVYRWVLGQRGKPDFGMPLPDDG